MKRTIAAIVIAAAVTLGISACATAHPKPTHTVSAAAKPVDTGVSVPDVSHESVADATTDLQSAGFNVTALRPDGSTAQPTDIVASTKPAGGATADKGTPVEIVTDPVVATQTFNGSGDNVENVNLGGLPAVLSFSCPSCDDNTVVKSNGADSLLVNTIGSYSGSHIIDGQQGSVTSQVSVQADGSWTLTVADLTTIPLTPGQANGTGDTVVRFGNTATSASISNTPGTANDLDNFQVTDYADTIDNVVNAIGGYAGTVTMTLPGTVQVISNGTWTITPS